MISYRKSSYSVDDNCVEVAQSGGVVLVRNSNRPDAGTVAITRAELAAWVAGCKAGEFDDMAH